MKRFDGKKSYVLNGSLLNALTAISAVLTSAEPMLSDKRRNLANVIDLVLMEAVELAHLPSDQR